MQVYSDICRETSSEDDFLEIPSVMRIQNLEFALNRAVDDISVLQTNLGYVIKIKEELETELFVWERREEALRKEFDRQLGRKEREIEALRQNQDELGQLLEDTKKQLQLCDLAVRQREDERKRLDYIIEDQKTTIHTLQEELLSVKFNTDLSYQNLTQDNMRLQELERENDQLKFQVQKAKGQLQKEAKKARHCEKDVDIFKAWLASVVGVRKVVEGCEGVLMQQITNRLLNCPKH